MAESTTMSDGAGTSDAQPAAQHTDAAAPTAQTQPSGDATRAAQNGTVSGRHPARTGGAARRQPLLLRHHWFVAGPISAAVRLPARLRQQNGAAAHNGANGQNAGAGNAQQNNIAMRDRLFYALFVRLVLTYARLVPVHIRRLIECVLLLKALFFATALIYIHWAYARSPADCLRGVRDTWPRDGVLRVLVPQRADAVVTRRGQAFLHSHYELHDPHSIEDPSKVPHIALIGNNYTFYDPRNYFVLPHMLYLESYSKTEPVNLQKQAVCDLKLSSGEVLVQSPESDSLIEPVTTLSLGDDGQEYEMVHHTAGYEYAIEYALEYGFLRLQTSTRARLNIPVLTVVLDPRENECFGDNFSRFILNEFLGYEDIVMSSVRALAENETNKGYLRDLITGEHYRFVTVWMARSAYIAAFFIMIIFTFSISMLLRFSHHQIFVFIVDLLHMFELNVAVAFPIAPLLTVILALIGMEAIMSEFFNDTSTAFYVILMVWLADQYDAICCHTGVSRRLWLRFFYLYHFVFYAYHYRFNGQYSGLALLTSWLFIQHSMVYFFHHYELPQVLREQQIQRLLSDLGDVAQQHRQHQQHSAHVDASATAQPHAQGVQDTQSNAIDGSTEQSHQTAVESHPPPAQESQSEPPQSDAASEQQPERAEENI